MKRIILVLFVLIASVSMLMAGGSSDAGQTASGGSVSVYASCDEQLARQLFEQFTAETGIAVNWIRLSGGEALARMEAESANPQASIWVGGVGLDHITAKTRNLTTPYQSREATHTPARYRDPEHFWIGLYVGPLTFVTNLDRARELGISPPRSWADLLRPEYRGHIRMPNPNTSGTAYNIITTHVTLNNGNEDAAFDYLRRLDANIDQYTRSGGAPGQSVAIGEIPIAIGYAHDQVRLRDAGANTVITAPSEGTGFELASMSLIRGGRDQVQARRLYDWILASPNAQRIFTEYYVVLVRNNATRHPLALTLDEVRTIDQNLVWDGDTANRTRLLDRWTREIESRR